jgi:hypothetical protein
MIWKAALAVIKQRHIKPNVLGPLVGASPNPHKTTTKTKNTSIKVYELQTARKTVKDK